MFVVDMHCDTLSDVNAEVGLVNKYNVSNKNPYLQFFAQFSKCAGTTPEERRRKLINSVNIYLSECERLGLINVSSGRDIFRATDLKLAAGMLTIEGGGGLFADSPELDIAYRAGLRVMGLAWDKNELSASAYDEEDTGLTEEGKKMADRAAELGIIIDVSHMSDRAFYDLFERSPMPHIATHSNFRELCPMKRNLTREMASMIAARGGVIGMNLFPKFLADDGASVDDVIRHIDYGLELLGENAIGFGFDIDGTRGIYPVGINTDSSIHDQVIEALYKRYSASVVERIAGENIIDFLKDNLM